MAEQAQEPEKSSGPALPQPTLPKGGGALAPIGEKFLAHPQTGTATFTIPVMTSAGRGGFGPRLALQYESGGGNGPYGVGFDMSVPSISRKTEKGLPRYGDADESDVFIISGVEDLVPIDAQPVGGERVIRYRPRVESDYSRIERHTGGGRHYWIVYSRDNVRSVYGYSADAQVADPANPAHIFRWLLEWVDDDKGNVAAYYYKREDGTGVAAASFERRRQPTQTYLKAIGYLNREMRLDRAAPPHGDLSRPRAELLATWPMVVLFDYGEHDETRPTFDEGIWPARPDAFSNQRSGFDIRTYRLCQRVLMFHRLGVDAHEVVRSTRLYYQSTAAITYLTGVESTGWRRRDDGTYATKSLPVVQLGYREITAFDTAAHTVERANAGGTVFGLDGEFRFLDYDGEGLPGILCEHPGGTWLYQRPEGLAATSGRRFASPRQVGPRPSVASADGWHLQDVNADGVIDAVRLRERPAGTFTRQGSEWEPFRPLDESPRIDWNDPNLRFADLDGDGFPDVVINDRDVIRWHAALTEEGRFDGYGAERRAPKPIDADDAQRVIPVFHNRSEAVFFADMTGDGLSDIVHIQRHGVAYWPNLGYGRFGQRVQMADAPVLDTPEHFDPAHIRLGDLDGTGTSDLIYCGAEGITLHLNQAGNSFAEGPTVRSLPAAHRAARVEVVDLWGTGTSCIVWSSGAPGESAQPIRYVDVLDNKKPHLLESIDNGLGSRTTIVYAPSTKFYLADRTAGRPWVTKLPFPIQVVDNVTVEDLVSETKFVTSYVYHHGFYDGVEREFRGFAMVEQRDTQAVAQFYGSGEFTDGLDQTLHIDPVLTKTWFHTGALIDAHRISKALAGEYWQGDKQDPQLPDSVVAGDLSAEELRQALRALRGRMLRQEIYAEDHDLQKSPLPYFVTENNYSVEMLREKGGDRYGVFAVNPRETLQLYYERNADDPRIFHELVISTSPYGDINDQVAIAYPRRAGAVTDAQSHLWATWTHRDYHDLDSLPNDYRVGVPKQETTGELAALSSTDILLFADVKNAISRAPGAYQSLRRPLHSTAPADPILIQQVRHYYWDETFSNRSDFNANPPPRALIYESLILALDDSSLALFAGRAQANETSIATLNDPKNGGYRFENGGYWSSTGVLGYDKNRFYLPVSLQNPFGGTATVDYDLTNALLPVTLVDPVGLKRTIDNDFRLLSPRAITDPNGTVSEVTTDVLGVVIGIAKRGAAGEGGPVSAMSYAFYAGPDLPTWTRVQTFPDYDPNGATIEQSYVYSDGLGRIVATKAQVKDGPLVDGGAPVSPRWVGTGRTVFNNKGLPVKKYEPYFSANSDFETERAIVMQGVTPVLHYDPLGRLIRVDQPNGTFSRFELDAWSQTSYDENDTVTDSKWYLDRTGAGSTATQREKDAATAAAAHANSPKVEHLDPLGRVVLTILDNKTETHETLVELDIQGNTLSVTDAEKKLVLDQWFDIAGRLLKSHSVDAGDTWTLPDAASQPLFTFRAQGADGIRIRSVRDESRRPTQTWVLKDGDPVTAEVLRERVVYGPATGGPDLAHGRVLDEFDGAGLAASEYDFRGNVLVASRRVLIDFQHEPEWSDVDSFDGLSPLPSSIDAALEPPLSTTTHYDAKGRPIDQTTPDGSVTTWTYDVAGMLAALSTRLGRRTANINEDFVQRIEYDAKGRRTLIEYGNRVKTEHHYDPQTFRLISLVSTGAAKHQDLSYVYDPVGNIISVADASQPTICFANQLVEAQNEYVYDAIYRLRHAKGREHPTQAGLDQRDIPTPLPLPTDCAALVNYEEDYFYDKAGNFKTFTHTTHLPTGPRTLQRVYDYVAGSNQLRTTTIGTDDSHYLHTDRGCMKSMAHLDAMLWNHRDELIAATRTRVGNGPRVTSLPLISNPIFLGYDLRGQRIRKVSISSGTVADRVYFGSYEIYRERPSPGATPTLQRETLNVYDDKARVALAETLTDGSEELVRYQLSNHLSSASVEVSGSGALISYEEFHPYGTTALQVQRAGSPTKRYRFTSEERDEETGLAHHGVRLFACWLGNWIVCDPIGIRGGLNLFSYCSRNPVGMTDPGGRAPAPTSVEEKARASLPSEHTTCLGQCTIPFTGTPPPEPKASGRRERDAGDRFVTGTAKGVAVTGVLGLIASLHPYARVAVLALGAVGLLSLGTGRGDSYQPPRGGDREQDAEIWGMLLGGFGMGAGFKIVSGRSALPVGEPPLPPEVTPAEPLVGKRPPSEVAPPAEPPRQALVISTEVLDELPPPKGGTKRIWRGTNTPFKPQVGAKYRSLPVEEMPTELGEPIDPLAAKLHAEGGVSNPRAVSSTSDFVTAKLAGRYVVGYDVPYEVLANTTQPNALQAEYVFPDVIPERFRVGVVRGGSP